MSNLESEISFVARSERRKEVLILLKNKKLSQPEIKKLTQMYKTHTSRVLHELSSHNLIKCLNPHDIEFKFYRLTSLGTKVLDYVFSMK